MKSDDPEIMPYLTALPRDPGDATKRAFKGSWWLTPSLGPRPEDALSQTLYDGMKATPRLFHIGIASGADRTEWKYHGTMTFNDPNIPSDGQTWQETLSFSLKLTRP